MKRIYTTTSLEEAQALCIALRGEGIEPLLENEHAAFSAVEMPTSAVPLGITVREEEAARAALLIHDLRQERETAASPPTDEDRRFQQKVEASRRRSRWMWGVAYVGPFLLSFFVCLHMGQWETALMLFAGFSLLVIFAGVISEREKAFARR